MSSSKPRAKSAPRCRSRRFQWACLLAALGIALAVTASADDRLTVIRLEAETLAASGDCERAIERLAAAREHAPGDESLLALQGQCELHLRRYVAAVESLSASLAIDARQPEAALHLAIASYHMGNFDGARAAITAARSAGSRSPRLDLYEGLLLLQASRYEAAALAFERARSWGGAAVEPDATFYAGVAWAGAENAERARTALERVARSAPDTDWAREANRMLAGRDHPMRYWGSATLGMEYDNNVILRGSDAHRPDDDGKQGDVLGLWNLAGGVELLSTRRFSGGLLASYTGTNFDEHSRFDLHYPTVSGWLDYRFAESTSARLRYDFGYSWTDGDLPLLMNNGAALSVIQDWNEWGATEVRATAALQNYFLHRDDQPDSIVDGTGQLRCPGGFDGVGPEYRCGPPGLDEADYRNPDGLRLGIAIEHVFSFEFMDSAFRGGYGFESADTHGQEYDGGTHRVHLGVNALLPFEEVTGRAGWGETAPIPIRLDLLARFTVHDFSHASSFTDPQVLSPALSPLGLFDTYTLSSKKRHDEVWEIHTEIQYDILPNWVASMRYSWEDHSSQVGIFDYKRGVFGLYLSAVLP